RRGLDVLYDTVQPLLGAAPPTHALTLAVGTPRGTTVNSSAFFDESGNSLVAGKAAVIPLGSDPQAAASAAAAAGARAVLLYGPAAPPGALRIAETLDVPVAWIPDASAEALLAAQRAGLDVGVAIGHGHPAANGDRGFIAGFSSRGLAFDGRIKPDVSAPGVALATAEPGKAPDGSALYGTVNGTSGAAASVAGAAALLVEMRPALTATQLRSMLVGYAQRGGAPATQTGAGTFRIGASAVGELSADQATLGFGIWQGPKWHAKRTLVIRNVSTRRLQVSVTAITTAGESEALQFKVSPQRIVLPEGRARRISVTVEAASAPPTAVVDGVIQIEPAGGQALRVPWALEFSAPSASLLPRVTINHAAFPASDAQPAILTVQAGAVDATGGVQIRAVSRLDMLLYTAGGRYVGVMARLRDLLPGTYSFGITGRGPNSIVLAPGSYELRLAAWPTLPLQATPSRATVRFRVE
ncbi:MAG TPA: S8 family serine peptidase, partial [Gaiellaceae bacterium]|nr:S8 family serine peptidase [Gaiellaceae bacterium]